MLREELGQPEHWWWLSFCDPAKPKGTQFLGGIYTRASGLVTAITKTHLLGINPGGEVKAFEIPDELAERVPFKFEDFADRLLSKKEIDEKLGGARKMP